LGASIFGEQASLVLQQLVLARDSGLGLTDLAKTAQPYPTYGQIVRELADRFQATRMERGLMASALRFFYGFQPRLETGNGASGPPPASITQADVHDSAAANPSH
jgi:hypothetical protein